MKLELEVLASSSIKRKKPWPRLAWIGERQESIFLIDDHRMSVLYVPSGKTKRKIPKLHNILADVTALNHSDDGNFVAGLLRSGDVFIYHKDSETLKYAQGINDLLYTLQNQSNNANRPYTPIDPPKPQIFITDDGSKLVVLMNRCKVYVWEQDADQNMFAPKRIDVKGSWSQVKPSPTVPMPNPGSRECSVDAAFYIHDVLGLCCSISFAFTIDQYLSITTAVIRWYEVHNLITYSAPTFYLEWTNVKYPLEKVTKDGGAVRAAGAYLCRTSHDGQLLATAVNQKQSQANKMVFVSPLTDVFVVADMKGGGARQPTNRNYRSYWVTDLQWTADDLFVVAMTTQGSVSVLTRLGEPLILKTFGCSIEMGPKYYLPLHPLITVQTPRPDADPSNRSQDDHDLFPGDLDPMRQRYSICCHPRKPIILCSDGYMVTALQLPVDMTCLSLMKGLVMESNSHLRRVRDSQKINLTLYDSMRRQGRVTKKLSLSGGVVGGRRVPNATTKSVAPPSGGSHGYRFEEPDEDALNNTIDEDDGMMGTDMFTGNMESGKIFFGGLDLMDNSALDLDASAMEESLTTAQQLEKAKSVLLLAWSLGASHCGMWTEEHEEVATNIAHNLVRLFSVILQSSPEVVKDLEAVHSQHSPENHPNVKNTSLVIILQTVKSALRLLHLDIPYQHLMVCAVRFAHSTLKLFLKDPALSKREPKLHTLHGCFTLLKVFERNILTVYTSLPMNGLLNGVDAHVQREFNNVYEPATASLYKNERTDIVTDVMPGYVLDGEAPHQRKLIRPKPGEEEQEEMRNAETYTSDINRRLIPVWKLLYKHIVGFYSIKYTGAAGAGAKGKAGGKVEDTLLELLMSVQLKLTSLGQAGALCPARKAKVQPGDRLSIEGCSVPALKAWMYQLNVTQGQGSAVVSAQRFLLSTLYSLLLQDELRAAVELTELLLKLPDLKTAVAACRQDQASKWATLAQLHQQKMGSESSEPPRHIENEAVEAVVRSLARVMAAYFSNQTLFVFPPHAPRVIPPLHRTYKLEHRVIPLYHESLANVIRTDGLDGVWTVERAVEYLLLAGLLPEAVWLANTLGDWKTAFVIGVAHMEHRQTHKHLYSLENKKDSLPVSLHPETLLQARLAQSFGLNSTEEGILLIDEETDMPQLRRSLNDLMLAATLSRIDIVPWLLEGLVARLRRVCSQFSAVVPSGLYLPAPPVYCPQPANTSQAGLGEDAKIEVTLRHEASSLIQLVFLVLEGANCTLPAARWYARRARDAVKLGKKFNSLSFALDEPDIPVLRENYLSQESRFTGRESDPSIHRILAAYRDFTSLVWMLYVRDKLSLGLRKKIQLIDRKMHKSPVPTETWLKHCRETLEWATQLVPFAHFLQEENDIFGITLSLITELPSDASTCNLLSLFFHDADNLDPEIQDKLQAVLKDWQGIFLEAAITPRGTKLIPRGTSMSFYFHKQSQRMEKFYRKKAKVFGEYEVFVFDPESEAQERENCGGLVSNGINSIGGRPFESASSFLTFLDVFYAVSFHKLVDAEEVTPVPQMPLLSANFSEFRKKELTSFAHKAVTSLHRKQMASDSLPISPPTSLLDLSFSKSIVGPPSRPKPPTSPRGGKIGLFRSRSFSELSSKRVLLPPRSPSVERRKASSHHDLRSLEDDRGFLELHTTKPGSSPKSSPRLDNTLQFQTQRTISGSDTLLTSEGIVPKMSLTRKCEIRRSCSVNDVDQAKKDKERTSKPSTLPQVDPLTKPVVAPTLLEKIEFGKKYMEVEQLLEWLSRWSVRNHKLSSKTQHQVMSGQTSLSSSTANLLNSNPPSPYKSPDFSSKGLQAAVSSVVKPVMRIRVQSRLMVYSLWLIEHHFNSPQLEDSIDVSSAPEDAGNTSHSVPVGPEPTAPGLSTSDTLAGSGTGLDTAPFSDSSHDTLQGPHAGPQPPPQPQHSTTTTQQAKRPERQEKGEKKQRERSLSPPKLSDITQDDGEETDVQSEWIDHQLLESSYMAQIVSAESNESISDGVIPDPRKKKKNMGILKKKKDKKKKKEKGDDGGMSTPSVGTSETLLRRLSFRKASQESNAPAGQVHNSSQVSDSTLNVSSLNEEELHDSLRETIRHMTIGSATSSQVQRSRPEISHPMPLLQATDEMPLLTNMSHQGELPDTRLDLRALEEEDGQENGGELRHIVRQELRKIVDAQHRGILAMLGALGEDDELPIGASTPHEKPTSGRRDKKHKNKKKSRRDGQSINTTQEVSFNERSSLTEIDITPLPSDEISLKSNSDNPLTVSDLFKSKTWSPGSRYEHKEVGNNVRGALKELKLLENSQSPHPNHVHFELENEQRLHGVPSSATAPGGKSGKENVVQKVEVTGVMNQQQHQVNSHQHQHHPPHGHPHHLTNTMPDTNQPFARVFEMLKAFNHSVNPDGLSSSQMNLNPSVTSHHQPVVNGMPLLRMNNPGGGGGVRFPPVPQSQVVGGSQVRGQHPGGTPRMPLLHLYTPHHRDEVPVRDVQLRFPPHPHATTQGPTSLVPPRMQLLTLQQPPQDRVFQHIEDVHGDLHLVPAEDLQMYEQRLQLEKDRKLEQRRKQMEALGLAAPPVEAVRQQEQRREKPSDKRKQRRQQRQEAEEAANNVELDIPVTQELEMTSQYVQADPILTSTQEVQVTYVPTPRDMATQGAQYPTPRDPTPRQEDTTEALHHGYALTPGLFDEYLTRDQEMGTALDNTARLQYQAAKVLQPRKLKEVGTETEGPGWTEQGTVIHRDQGTDPVAEALEAYSKARQGLSAQGILAPDVYMGLQFSATDAPTQEAAGAKRAFINVVDLDGASLDDIVSSSRGREVTRETTSRAKSPRRKKTDKSRERSHVHYEDEEEVEEDVALGPDRVTGRVFSHRSNTDLRDSREWDSAIIQSARSQAKGSIRQRLGNMNAQFQAIDDMSKNIEQDYKSARRMIQTIEQIGHAMSPTPDLEYDSQEEDVTITPRASPKRTSRKPGTVPDKPSPIPEVSEEDRSTARSRRVRISQESLDTHRSERQGAAPETEEEESRLGLDLTGLSGVSDIIADVIASGRVDPAQLGLSHRQSQRLAEKAAASARDKSGLDDLLRSGEMVKEEEKGRGQRTERERAQLRAWMEEKKRKHMEDFRQRQQELREKEHDPYRGQDESAHMSTLTMKELEEYEHKRVHNKKQREMEHAERRRQEASALMGDILTDRPELPDPLPARDQVRKRTPSISPVRRANKGSPAAGHRAVSRSPRREAGPYPRGGVQHQPRSSPQRQQAWDTSPARGRLNKDNREYERQPLRHSGERAAQMEGSRKSGLMSGSGMLNTQTGTSSAGLRAYTHLLENVQSSYEPESQQIDTTLEGGETQEEEPAVPLYKPKPYTEMVKVQRPEMTRQNRPRSASKPYVERLSEVSKSENTPRSDDKQAVLAKQRLYGSKRIPGTQTIRTAPRTVKTYQERLREMKQARQQNPSPTRRYTGPIRARGAQVRPLPSAPARVRKPKKKPLTYQQQLQALQPPKEMYRTGTLNTTTTSGTMDGTRARKRKGPPHKPLTYTQQLQALQPPKDQYRTSADYGDDYPTQSSTGRPMLPSHQHRSPPQHVLRRSGPYPDPYTQPVYQPEDDRASVASPWSVDEDVRRLIYDGASSTYVGASVAGTELDLSELQDLAGLGSEAAMMDYTDMVDVREIADAASVSEGSIMSFIDWDQVDDLIADVY